MPLLWRKKQSRMSRERKEVEVRIMRLKSSRSSSPAAKNIINALGSLLLQLRPTTEIAHLFDTFDLASDEVLVLDEGAMSFSSAADEIPDPCVEGPAVDSYSSLAFSSSRL